MTLAAEHAGAASSPRAPGDARAGIGATADVALGVAIAAAVLLSHPYQGIMGDGMIYIGRALADVDPDGVGRDLMFRLDGQSGFSVFRLLARWCIARLGVETAAWLLSVGGLIAYSLAILCCVRTIRPGRTMAVVLAAALLLPRAYVPSEIFAAGEALAIPRPWAEALVLLAVACLAEKRIAPAFALVAVAAAVHPIMTLPGLILLAMVLGAGHGKRLLAFAIGALVLVVLSGWAGVPLASRIVERIDPAWLEVLRSRTSYLFVGMWTIDAWSRIAVLIATLLLGAAHAPPAWRRIMHATAAVALLGCLASFIGADLLSSLLFVQVQLWRSLWLAAALAPVAAGLCLPTLANGDWRERAVVAALAAAWASTFIAPVNAVLALLALGLARTVIDVRLYKGVCVVAALVVLFAITLGARMIAAYWTALPPQMHLDASILWRFCYGGFFVIAAVAWCASFTRSPTARLCASLLLVAALTVALVGRYDERTDLKKDVDSASLKPDLVATLARRPGEILWLGDEALWYWTRRANWNERLQGAGIVFSRDLALLWYDRARALVSRGLAGEDLLDPLKAGAPHAERSFDAGAIAQICARPDAPAWIVMPLRDGAAAPADPRVEIWAAPFVQNQMIPESEGFTLRSSSRRLLIPCSTKAS